MTLNGGIKCYPRFSITAFFSDNLKKAIGNVETSVTFYTAIKLILEH